MTRSEIYCRCGHRIAVILGSTPQTVPCPVCRAGLEVPVARQSSQPRPVRKTGRGAPGGTSGLPAAAAMVAAAVGGLAVVALLLLAFLWTTNDEEDFYVAPRDVAVDQQSEGSGSTAPISVDLAREGRWNESNSSAASDDGDDSLSESMQSIAMADPSSSSTSASEIEEIPTDSMPSGGDGSSSAASSSVRETSATTDSGPGEDDSPMMEDRKSERRYRSLADLIEKVEPSIVRIDVRSNEGQSIGSGFAVDDAGTIVTNFHVVEGAIDVSIRNPDAEKANCKGFLFADPVRDIAILRVNDDIELPALPIAADYPRKGISVASFGCPLGLDFTASEGVVSAIREKDYFDNEPMFQDLEDGSSLSAGMRWIQTTAAISGGNSGGPLVNFDGEMVGMNTWTINIGQNLNFAVPMSEVRDALTKVSSTIRPWDELPQKKKSKRRRRSNSPDGDWGSETVVELTGIDFQSTEIPSAVRQFKHSDEPISRLAVSPDGSRFAIACMDGQCYVVTTKGGIADWKLKTDDTPITDVVFAGKPSKLYSLRSAPSGSTISIRDPDDGEETSQSGLRLPLEGSSAGMSVSQSGRSILGLWKNGVVRMWRLDPRRGTYEISTFLDRKLLDGIYASSADWSDSGNQLAVGASNGWLSVSSIVGRSLKLVNQKLLFDGIVQRVLWCDNDQTVLAAGDTGEVVACRSFDSRKMRQSQIVREGGAAILSMSLSPDEERLVIGRVDGQVEVWDRQRRERLDSIESYTASATDVAFIAGGRYVVASFSDGMVLIYPAS